MVEIDLTPTYQGLWIAADDLALFHLWKKEKGFGKIWEMSHRRLVESDITKLIDNGCQIDFVKRYTKQPADLLKGDIIYSGSGNGNGFYDGEWEGANSDVGERKGIFYLANAKEDWALKELEKILGNLHFQKLEDMIKNKQKDFHYTPII